MVKQEYIHRNVQKWQINANNPLCKVKKLSGQNIKVTKLQKMLCAGML